MPCLTSQVYGLLLSSKPGAAGPLMEWGRLLAGPAVVRPAEACVALEDAALLAANAHLGATTAAVSGGKAVAKAAGQARAAADRALEAAVSTCLEGIANLTAGVAQPGSLPASTDQPATVLRQLDAPLLARCVEGRAAVYRALAREPVTSRAARRAVYR
jgi:hypothetical protein